MAVSDSSPRRPRIVHIIHDDGAGGGPKTVLNHITFYSTLFEVSLIHGGSGMLAQTCRDLAIPQYRIAFDKIWKLPLGFLQLVMRLRALAPDLVILHGQWAGPVGALACTGMRGVKKLYIVQWPAFYTDWDLRRLIRNWLVEAIPCRLCDAVVAISRGNMNEFLRRFPASASRFRHIPNAIDLQAVPDRKSALRLREELKWSRDEVHVVCVGRLATQKRVDWLLDAWREVERCDERLRLWIVGDGEERASLEALTREWNLRRCVFLGARQGGMTFMSAADIVAIPSMYEGHANTPIEAMAAGRAVVASAVDGIRESFTDGCEGFLVPPGDAGQMARRILELAQDPQRRAAMGANGRQRVRVYEKGPVMKRYLELVFSLINSTDRA